MIPIPIVIVNTYGHRGYTIKPRNDPSWPEGDRGGFWITKDGANVGPGACWFRTVEEASQGIDDLIQADGNTDKFWQLDRLRRWHDAEDRCRKLVAENKALKAKNAALKEALKDLFQDHHSRCDALLLDP